VALPLLAHLHHELKLMLVGKMQLRLLLAS
jgi:hypothetical protein